MTGSASREGNASVDVQDCRICGSRILRAYMEVGAGKCLEKVELVFVGNVPTHARRTLSFSAPARLSCVLFVVLHPRESMLRGQ